MSEPKWKTCLWDHTHGQMSTIFTPFAAAGVRFLPCWASSVEVGVEKMRAPASQELLVPVEPSFQWRKRQRFYTFINITCGFILELNALKLSVWTSRALFRYHLDNLLHNQVKAIHTVDIFKLNYLWMYEMWRSGSHVSMLPPCGSLFLCFWIITSKQEEEQLKFTTERQL